MDTLFEYNAGFETANGVTFDNPEIGGDWDWLFQIGENSQFDEFNCLINKYIGKLYTMGGSFGPGCFFNLTSYLFEEMAEINFYNLTNKSIIDPYSLKYDIEIDEWPWLLPCTLASCELKLCMLFESNVQGFNVTSDDLWVNLTFGAELDFEIAFPELVTCNGNVNSEVVVTVDGNEASGLAEVCVDIPYCAGKIYYDPIISSNYEGTPPADDDGLTGGEIAGIVIGCLFGVALIAGVAVCCSRRKRGYQGLLET